MLLKTDEQALCLTCHTSTGSALNVQAGINNNTQGGLRGGGFLTNRVGASTVSVLYYAGKYGPTVQEGTIPATSSPQSTTSAHGLGSSSAFGYLGLDSNNAVVGGTLGSSLECGSCHDPHGNGNYRLLKPLPSGVKNVTLTATAASVLTATVNSVQTSTVTITTSSQHWFGAGGTVTVKGYGAPYDGTWNITAVPTYTSFSYVLATSLGTDGTITITQPATAPTVTNPGTTIKDVPLAGTHQYTTTNYWAVDDENAPTSTYAGTANVTSFIGNIAAWCTQCHTRYMTGPSGTYANSSGDSVFTYRHRGNRLAAVDAKFNGVHYTNQVNSANCIQCHVAHGTSATAVDSALGVTYPGTSTPEGSALLRVSNRGVCQFCHNK